MAVRAYETFERGESRAMDARAANDRIAEKARTLRFLSRVPMMCECSSPSCRTIVMVSLGEYREIRQDPDLVLTAPGHDADRGDLQKGTAHYEIHRTSHRRGNGNGDRRSA